MRSQDLALFPYLSCGALLLSLAFSFAMFVFRFLRLFQKMPLFQKPRRKIYRCRFCAGRRRHDPKKRFQTVSSRRRFWWQLWWTLMFAYIHPFYSCPLKTYPSNIFDTNVFISSCFKISVATLLQISQRTLVHTSKVAKQNDACEKWQHFQPLCCFKRQRAWKIQKSGTTPTGVYASHARATRRVVSTSH